VVLQDLALTFEMLRAVNTAKVRGAQVAGTGPVLTVRRAIAMLGLDGVRRVRAVAARLARSAGRGATPAGSSSCSTACKRAARVAQSLRPAGYDAEVVYLVSPAAEPGAPGRALSLSRRGAADPAPDATGTEPQEAGEPDDPGMSEEGAAFAVLGTGIDASAWPWRATGAWTRRFSTWCAGCRSRPRCERPTTTTTSCA
jgi:hypothetical protein